MHGLMMDQPLLVTDILRHAVRATPKQEIVTRLVEGGIHRCTFEEVGKRVAQLAHALTSMGVGVGDRVGVIGWNTHRQLELYYATAVIGAVCHTINPRLGPENAGYVINHAEDKVMFFDTTFHPLVAGLAPHTPTIEHYVAMTPSGQTMPVGDKEAASYEDMIARFDDTYDYPELDERTACGLCYTSGTMGEPKGVMYTHRSTVLHALVTSLPSSIGFSQDDVLLPVVPMFHVNAWGVPYSALMLGMKTVMPGPGLDGASLHELMEQEKVTFAMGVPTVWLNLLNYVETNNLSFSTLKYNLSGGAALSERLIVGFEKFGVRMRQGWGMTETSPTGTVNIDQDDFFERPQEERIPIQLMQGKPLPFVGLRIVDEDNQPVPHDGKSDGYLHIKGPWVLSQYYRREGATLTEDGWFDTGDVSVIHPDGRMQITDRAKDVIKSGGEWISTIDIENAALSHDKVANAAAVGMPHPKWQERPLLIVQLGEGVAPEQAVLDDILAFVNERLPKISWPDDIVAVEEIPIGATGKVLKRALRDQLKDYVLPTAKSA